MIEPISFTVPGIAKPAGSKRGFALKRNGAYTGRVVVTDACKGSRDWKTMVSAYAGQAMNGRPPIAHDIPLKLCLEFMLPRPKGHLRKDGTVKDSAPIGPIVRPDASKLTRGVEDALSSLVYHDDAQIITQVITKRYTTGAPCVNIRVSEAEL